MVEKAKVLVDLKRSLANGRYRVELKVYDVGKSSKKHPEGVKVRYVLIDVHKKAPRLLIDNHAPFGFHVHTELPHDKSVRKPLKVKGHEEAMREFFRLTQEIIDNET